MAPSSERPGGQGLLASYISGIRREISHQDEICHAGQHLCGLLGFWDGISGIGVSSGMQHSDLEGHSVVNAQDGRNVLKDGQISDREGDSDGVACPQSVPQGVRGSYTCQTVLSRVLLVERPEIGNQQSFPERTRLRSLNASSADCSRNPIGTCISVMLGNSKSGSRVRSRVRKLISRRLGCGSRWRPRTSEPPVETPSSGIVRLGDIAFPRIRPDGDEIGIVEGRRRRLPSAEDPAGGPLGRGCLCGSVSSDMGQGYDAPALR